MDRQGFFDDIASRWDRVNPAEPQHDAMDRGLDLLALAPHHTILDVGCGTGALIERVLPRLGAQGRVLGLDFSAIMLEKAQEKINDPRVTWIRSHVLDAPVPPASVDRLLCYNSYPHLPQKGETIRAFARYLRSGGRFLLWHDCSRERIREIHQGVGHPIGQDLLPSIEELVALAQEEGFTVLQAVEDDCHYLLYGQKPAP